MSERWRRAQAGPAGAASEWPTQQLPALRVSPAVTRYRARVRADAGAWTQLTAIGVAAALGLLLVAGADALGRSGRGGSTPLFWAGLLLIVVPAVVALAGARAGRAERAAILLAVGLALYLVKVFLDPFGFTFADELVHQYNASEIVRTGSLFHANPILPITPRYPGLETAAAALSSLTGLGTFGAGLLVIGAARVVELLALFLLFERLTGSSRIAGVGTLLYTATPNFVFFDAQFSYESLALPLALVAVLALVRWTTTPSRSEGLGWAAVVALAVAAVVATHHVTSYALAAFLVAAAVASLLSPRPERRPLREWSVAAGATAAVVAWLVGVAPTTSGYLQPVFSSATTAVGRTLRGESGTRKLFAPAGTASHTPVLEHIVGVASILIVAAALPFALFLVWRRYRSNRYVLLLALMAIAYLAVLPVRLVPDAWEVANRSSEFLGIGTALLLGVVGVALWSMRWPGPLLRIGVLAATAIVFAGGVIASWGPPLRQAHPYEVSAGGRDLPSPGVAAATWFRDAVGPGQRVAADEANARLELALARERVFAGNAPDVADVLLSQTWEPWQRPLLSEYGIRYLVVDRRRSSSDRMLGYYFSRTNEPLLPGPAYRKFDRGLAGDRVYDSGDIVVYRLGSGG